MTKLNEGQLRAINVARELVAPNAEVNIKTHESLGFIWKLIYWTTFIITFGKVKMTRFGFVLGETMYVSDITKIQPELIIHEAVHMRQRGKGIHKLVWYFNYIFLLPTIFTMRSVYEGDAYAVSCVISALDIMSRRPSGKVNVFNSSLFNQVLKIAFRSADWYEDNLAFAWPYFFMAIRRRHYRNLMKMHVEAALRTLYGAESNNKLSESEILECNRWLEATNVVAAASKMFKK